MLSWPAVPVGAADIFELRRREKMKISELAKRSGLSASRIRFYERVGLLKAVKRQTNGYRSYTPDAVQELRVIVAAQNAGFSLDELRALMPVTAGQWDHQRLIDTLASKLRDIERLEAQLAQSKAQLQAVMADILAKPAELDCADNAKRVLANIESQSVPDADAKPQH